MMNRNLANFHSCGRDYFIVVSPSKLFVRRRIRGSAGGHKRLFRSQMSRNSDRIWNLLAPSSIVKRFYSFENYLESARLNPVRIVGYQLKFSPEVMENQDRKRFAECRINSFRGC